MNTYEIIIIGGGAAGLMAAITAARQGQSSGQNILVLEKNKNLGRKILVTGNGRCNLTNAGITAEKFARPDNAGCSGGYYGQNTKGLPSIFSRWSAGQTMQFFEALGARLKTEEQGRVFPATNQASTIVDLLSEEIAALGINVRLEEKVTGVNNIGAQWEIKTDKGIYRAKKVILTTGGRSYPQLGSSGDGYDFAARLGLKVIEPRPALVSLELEGNWFHKLQGVKTDTELTLSQFGKTIALETGELLFTHYGISGPVVLNLSRLIIDYARKPGFTTAINFFPGFNADGVAKMLAGRWQLNPQKTLGGSLIGLLPRKICQVLVSELKIPAEVKVSQIAKKDLLLMAQKFTAWPLAVRKARPFTEAMVTAGGVAMDEIDARTMESVKCKDLYLAGEILDIDGISGGYNLQFAWSTGYIAGTSAAGARPKGSCPNDAVRRASGRI